MAIDADDKTEVRVTFRTYRSHVEKLRGVARAHGLKSGRRYSIGKALNFVIEKHAVRGPKKAR